MKKICGWRYIDEIISNVERKLREHLSGLEEVAPIIVRDSTNDAECKLKFIPKGMEGWSPCVELLDSQVRELRQGLDYIGEVVGDVTEEYKLQVLKVLPLIGEVDIYEEFSYKLKPDYVRLRV